VYNPLGGMGTTTIAVNLAAALALKGEMTALVDLNPFSSDVSAFLNLHPAYTLSALQESGRRMNTGRLMNIMTRHSSGMQVLCGPEETGIIVEIPPDQILSLITLMKGEFGVTLFDAGGALSERNQETFDCSDIILYPLVLTLPALNNARRYLKSMNSLGFGPDRVKVVINRYFPRDGITVAHAEEFLEEKVFHTIPNSYPEIKKSIYNGSPIVINYPRSPVTKAITELARQVTTEFTGGWR
jgi:pilus assembly protein CpaE